MERMACLGRKVNLETRGCRENQERREQKENKEQLVNQAPRERKGLWDHREETVKMALKETRETEEQTEGEERREQQEARE